MPEKLQVLIHRRLARVLARIEVQKESRRHIARRARAVDKVEDEIAFVHSSNIHLSCYLSSHKLCGQVTLSVSNPHLGWALDPERGRRPKQAKCLGRLPGTGNTQTLRARIRQSLIFYAQTVR